ncbi:MATE family efflux transporter [Pararhizobium sp. A13]|uniref:MATE family efflux transporter n=1 Tax=Pararhizobium sp. A13 TaxID=3133975 RepID=UPI003250639D
MSSDTSSQNAYLTAPLGAIFTKTALPIIFVMSMNGLLTVADAVFLGIYVGPDAVGAVTVVFPVFMLLIALSTLVASGMASLLARHLGAGRFIEARRTLTGAHILALAIGIAFMVLFAGFGERLALVVANGNGVLAGMAHVYISIIVFSCPIPFLLSVNADALRCEGRAGLMAILSLAVSLANLVFNYVFIVGMGLGVAGSACGTVLAQGVALGLLLCFRSFGRTALRFSLLRRSNLVTGWGEIIGLGAPQSLGFIGLALVSATIIASLQMVAGTRYDVVVSAYGIITRVMTFAFLPLLGMSQAVQAIVGNSVGAGLWQRSYKSLRLGVAVALVYCLAVEILLIGLARPIGSLFVSDNAVADDVARIMPVMVALYFLSGPLMLTAGYFQAIGDVGRAAILGLSKPYLFAVPLVIVLAAAFGEGGIWFATPVSEILLLGVTIAVLWKTTHQCGLAAVHRPEREAEQPL